jgi:cyclopropane fatty-acyl-phospholipid synthase-like methyltransferase
MIRLNPDTSKVYDKEYFFKHFGGGPEFQRSKGKELYDPHKHAIQLADLRPDDRVLDLGCGRGEVALNVAGLTKSVLAIDYSQHAIDLALEAS